MLLHILFMHTFVLTNKTMKKITLIAGILAIVASTAFAGKPQTSFKVNKTESTLAWLGKKVTGQHSGAINLSDGELLVNDKTVVGGKFDIDMNSITCEDLKDATWNGKLIGHLKADDFFGTEKFPKASFEITEVKATDANDHFDVKGKLTIKGVTNEVTFPATIKNAGNAVIAVAKITVDRTKYGIKYGSKSFFESIGDKAIDNEFTMDVKIVANK